MKMASLLRRFCDHHGVIEIIGAVWFLFGHVHSLRQEEGRASTVFLHAFDGIVLQGKDGLIKKCNPAFAHLFGYAPQDLIDRKIDVILRPPGLDRLIRYMDRFLISTPALPTAFSDELLGRKKNGAEIPVDISLAGTETQGSLLFIGVVRDVSRRKKREERKDAFISTVNYELRTPLGSALDSLHYLRDTQATSLDSKGRRALDTVYDNCVRLSAFLDDVLDTDRIASGKMAYTLERVNICPLVQHIVETQQDVAERFHVSLVVESGCSHAFCSIDSSRFMQAIVNLLSNAFKFSPDGETVTVRISKESTQALISVIDHGPGIPADIVPRLFEKFLQAENPPAKAAGGSGLGLCIAKAIITAFSGTLTYEPDEKGGVRFDIRIPLLEE